MRPIRLTRQLAVDANAIAEDQTTVGAGSLVLNGVLAETIQNTFETKVEVPLGGRQITLESAGNLSGVNFTITGRDFGDNVVSEVIAGPNAGTIATARTDWNIITDIAVDGAVGTAVEIGVNLVGATGPVPLDQYISPFNVSLGIVVSGTVDVTVQYTFDDVFDGSGSYTWFNHPDLTSVAANADGAFVSPVSACRLLSSAGDGTAQLEVIQAGVQ